MKDTIFSVMKKNLVEDREVIQMSDSVQWVTICVIILYILLFLPSTFEEVETPQRETFRTKGTDPSVRR